MRRVTRFKRSTAPSKAWMPNARPQCCCQAPQPRSGAPKAQGLIAARWPQHNRPCRRSLPADAPTANNISTGANGSVALQLQSRISTSLTDVTHSTPRESEGLSHMLEPLAATRPALLPLGHTGHQRSGRYPSRSSAAPYGNADSDGWRSRNARLRYWVPRPTASASRSNANRLQSSD